MYYPTPLQTVTIALSILLLQEGSKITSVFLLTAPQKLKHIMYFDKSFQNFTLVTRQKRRFAEDIIQNVFY